MEILFFGNLIDITRQPKELIEGVADTAALKQLLEKNTSHCKQQNIL